MKRHRLSVTSRLCLTIVAVLVCIASAANADNVTLAENWYVRLTQFWLFDYSNTGFTKPYSYQWSTTSLIEPKLSNPDSDAFKYATLLFDFHAGQILTTDYASFCPYATCGSTWGGEMSFKWEIYCTDPRLVFYAVSGWADGDSRIWWTAPTGTGYRTGTTQFYASTWGPSYAQVPPSLVVQFTPVPEPSTIIMLLCGVGATVSFAMRGRMSLSRHIG
jgi:hypothetical protein